MSFGFVKTFRFFCLQLSSLKLVKTISWYPPLFEYPAANKEYPISKVAAAICQLIIKSLKFKIQK